MEYVKCLSTDIRDDLWFHKEFMRYDHSTFERSNYAASFISEWTF